MLCKNALTDHASRFPFDADTVYVGTCFLVDHAPAGCSFVPSPVEFTRWKISSTSAGFGGVQGAVVVQPRSSVSAAGGAWRQWCGPGDRRSLLDYDDCGSFLAGARFCCTDIHVWNVS